jgi:Xaa-Pro aminopeptidase
MIPAKIGQAVGILKELDIDVWLIFVRESAALHDPCIDLVVGANVTWQSAFLITRRGERIALLGSLDAPAHEALGLYHEITPYVQGIGEPLRAALSRLDPKRIAVNYSVSDEMADGLTHGMFLLLQDILASTPYGERLVSSERVVSLLRSRKLDLELAHIARACEETADVFSQLDHRLRTGMTERQIARVMVEAMDAKGLEPAWESVQCPTVSAGPESSGAHAGSAGHALEPGDLMHVSFGMRYQGYCSDLQRTWYCLSPGETEPPEPVRRGFAAVRDAVHKAADFLRPGVKGHEVDAVARGHIVSQGFQEFPHALGHQIGRESHDGAGLLCPAWERYGDKAFATVEEGQCYTLGPSVPIPGHGMAWIEEIVVVTASGCRFLSDPQTEVMLVRS